MPGVFQLDVLCFCEASCPAGASVNRTIPQALSVPPTPQDNYLAEGLKIRNLVSEFHPDSLRNADGSVAPLPEVALNLPAVGSKERRARRQARAAARGGDQTVALVGFREWIFSENSGVLPATLSLGAV